ncbi:hypothetical protein HNO88_003240 [Novosphingobium chloroacetimidivorans]|uniref:DUF2490 domain-containing protein n=1 Tax=Novosphingobium chloroacetimidivorans TaxID=1428314 RepID=A0A7W7KBR9_9SPHN|nr:DUF2490 domain-containing protein [Novosphingobium chloroacetimidivorans]MBB4859907.1 hypothetical protein [Novosphingobium chloroacetimidivorans]
MPKLTRPALSCLAALPAMVSLPALAAQEDEQLWLQTNVHVPLDSGTRVTLEQIARFGDRPDGLYTTEFGALFGQKISKSLEFGFGYRHVAFHNGNTNRDEDRFRQQVIGTFGRFSTRLRLDERFHPGGDEIGFRLRPLVRYNHPLNDKGLVLFVSHESFIIPNTTRWGQRRGYERMRNQLGFAVPLSAKANADISYLNQYRLARGGARAQMDHALSLQLTINLAAKSKRADLHQGD